MIGQIKMKYIRNLFSKMVNGFQIYSNIFSNGFRIYSNNFCGIEVRVVIVYVNLNTFIRSLPALNMCLF